MTESLQLNATVLGDGPDIIIMHGLFGSQRNWMGHAKALAINARIHLLDLRNHGQSPWADSMTYPEMARDLKRYLDDHDLEKAHIVGHSMGGKTAMQFALLFGERINRLLIADIAPVQYDRTYNDYLGAMRSSPLHQGKRPLVDEHLASVITERGVRAFLLQNLVRQNDGLAWRINIDAIERCMPSIMDAPDTNETSPFQGTTLFLRGENSDYVQNDHRGLIKQLFPQNHIIALKDAGHWLHAEQPENFIKAMRGFFKLPGS